MRCRMPAICWLRHPRRSDPKVVSHPASMQVFLNLVLEYVPETVYRIGKHYSKAGQRMPTLFVKLYVWQVRPHTGI